MDTDNMKPIITESGKEEIKPSKPDMTANIIKTKRQESKLSIVEKAALKNLFEDHFNNDVLQADSKKKFFKMILREIPELTEKELNRLYVAQEHSHYQQLKRIPAEALINKINVESDALKAKVIAESQRDMTHQAKVINEINETVAKVNKLTDVAPRIEVNFHQEIPDSELINNAEVIELTPEGDTND